MMDKIKMKWTLAACSLIMCVLVVGQDAHSQEATCRDLYDQVYESCFMGGLEIGTEGCAQMVEMLGPALMSDEGLNSFSAALSLSICKQGCEDAATSGQRMPFSSFRREFCGRRIK
jgi:hypothetical protein